MSVRRPVICRHVHVHGRGVRMFGGVREGRRADVVGRYLDLVGKRPFDMRVEIDRHRRTARKSHESRCQPALGQDRRVNTTCTRSTGACPRAIRRGSADLLRIFDPNVAAYHEFVGGWVLAEVVDAARQVDGNREVVDGILGEWSVVAADTGAPHLEVHTRYTKAVLAHGNAEPLYEDAISVGSEGWPIYAARAHLAYGAWLRRQHRMTESRAPLREAARSLEALGLIRFAELPAASYAPRARRRAAACPKHGPS